jgi:dTMP kinase
MERKALAFHRRLRRGFLVMAKREPRRFLVLDATQPAPKLHQEIIKLVLRRLTDARR